MERQLLITLMFGDTSRTYPYDVAARASLTLGVPVGTGTVAVGHVEPDGEGAALFPETSCALYTAAGDEVGACALTGSEGTVLSIVSPKLDQAISLYVRPLEPGGRRFAKLGFVLLA